jgi:hypothetical protein
VLSFLIIPLHHQIINAENLFSNTFLYIFIVNNAMEKESNKNKSFSKIKHRRFCREGNGKDRPYVCLYDDTWDCKYWLSCKKHYNGIVFFFKYKQKLHYQYKNLDAPDWVRDQLINKKIEEWNKKHRY